MSTPDIFLSFKHDSPYALPVADRLKAELAVKGVGVYRLIDTPVPPSQNLEKGIEEAIRGVRGIVFLISDESYRSRWIRWEYGCAIRHHVPRALVMFPSVPVPLDFPDTGVYVPLAGATTTQRIFPGGAPGPVRVSFDEARFGEMVEQVNHFAANAAAGKVDGDYFGASPKDLMPRPGHVRNWPPDIQ